jgi:carboxymethylenebutenolidase
MATRVTFQAKSGAEASGEIALPAGEGKAPGVVLLQEWWGINDHIRSLLGRLAEAGFVACAPDLYHGKIAKDAETAGKMMGELDWPKAMDEIAGAAAYVASHPRSNGKVGVTGFCLGGALTLAATTMVPQFAAAVAFYGVPGAGKADWSKVKAPIMAHFAARDEWAKPSLAEDIKKELETRGQKMVLHVYDADHAFVNDTRPEVYNAEAAKLAWTRSMEFLHQHLG